MTTQTLIADEFPLIGGEPDDEEHQHWLGGNRPPDLAAASRVAAEILAAQLVELIDSHPAVGQALLRFLVNCPHLRFEY